MSSARRGRKHPSRCASGLQRSPHGLPHRPDEGCAVTWVLAPAAAALAAGAIAVGVLAER